MKYIKLIALLFIFDLKLNASETVLLNFETETVPKTVSLWTNYPKSENSTSTWRVPNPKSDELNSSSGIALTYTPEGGNQSGDNLQTNQITDVRIDYVSEKPGDTELKTPDNKIADNTGVYYFGEIWHSDNSTPATETIITIDPSQKYQVIEGWGASLCWWANVMGGYSDVKVKTICDWITDPDKGLNMNIFRFNIGGGDDPSHDHMRSDGGDMPGYKLSDTADYDWSQDGNQRKILQQLIASRIENTGVNDIQLIAFSNSPPYWMTHSGCSAGNTTGNVCNLKSDMFDDFAGYLTDVVKYYHDSLNITFNYIEPFNEPDANWWIALGGQEGCYFSNSDQINMIRELYAKLQEKEILSYCKINTNDANTIDHTYSAVQAYEAAGDILPMIDLVSTHSYGGNNRSLLANWMESNDKKLWQSESGPLYVGDSYESQIMIMADRIITDLRDLKCTAWCDWQLAGTGDLSNSWAQIVSDYDDLLEPISRNTNYYMRAQFSRYIKSDYTIIESSAANSIAALSPGQTELVLVISNNTAYTQDYLVDLSNFTNFGKVKQFRTRASESYGIRNSEDRFTITGNSFTYSAQPESVTTFVIPINDLSSETNQIKETKNTVYYFNGNIYMNFSDRDFQDISIYNTEGQLIFKNIQVPGNTIYPIHLENGVYIVVSSGNYRKDAFKIAVYDR